MGRCRGAEVPGTGAWGFGGRRSSCLTDAARLSDVVEGPEQVTPQLLDVDEVVHHGVGEVHPVVQVDGVALGPPEGHVERSCLTCQDLGESGCTTWSGWGVSGALLPLQASEPSGLPHSLRLVDKMQGAYSDPDFR